MPLTINIFLWVNGLFFALLLVILGLLWGLKADLKPITSLVKTIDDWLRKEGLDKVLVKVKGQANANHSLPPDKAARRDELVALGKLYGLTESEATELRALLQEEARDDFAKGVLGALAFAALMLTIGAIIASLTKK